MFALLRCDRAWYGDLKSLFGIEYSNVPYRPTYTYAIKVAGAYDTDYEHAPHRIALPLSHTNGFAGVDPSNCVYSAVESKCVQLSIIDNICVIDCGGVLCSGAGIDPNACYLARQPYGSGVVTVE